VEKVLQQILGKLNELSQGQEALQKGQEAQGQRLERLEKGQNELRSSLHQVQENLQSQIAKLEIRLETEAFEKIGALFDGFQLHREILERIEKKLEAHDERLDSHGDEIVLLRSKKK